MDPETGAIRMLVECESGDAVEISAGSVGVFLSLDDCDETPVPTAHLTREEARRIAAALLNAVES